MSDGRGYPGNAYRYNKSGGPGSYGAQSARPGFQGPLPSFPSRGASSPFHSQPIFQGQSDPGANPDYARQRAQTGRDVLDARRTRGGEWTTDPRSLKPLLAVASRFLRINPWLNIVLQVGEAIVPQIFREPISTNPGDYDVAPTGWTVEKLCGPVGSNPCPSGIDLGTEIFSRTAGVLGTCPCSQLTPTLPVLSTTTVAAHWVTHKAPPFADGSRARVVQRYTRTDPAAPFPWEWPNEPAVLWPGTDTTLSPYTGLDAPPMIRGLDPMTSPIGRPVPFPASLPYAMLPYRVSHPFRAVQREVGPQPKPRTATPAAPSVTVGLGPDGRPVVETSASTQTGAWGGRNTRVPGAVGRPPYGVRESKFTSLVSAPGLYRILNNVTEGIDALECFFKALPKARRKEATKHLVGKHKANPRNWGRTMTKPSPQTMMAAVWKWHDELDAQELLECLAEEHGEDKLFGKIGKQVSGRGSQGPGGKGTHPFRGRRFAKGPAL